MRFAGPLELVLLDSCTEPLGQYPSTKRGRVNRDDGELISLTVSTKHVRHP